MANSALLIEQDDALRLTQLFDEAPVAYHEIDTLAVLRRVNRSECELLGFPAEELLGRQVWDLLSIEEREKSRQAVLDKLAERRPLRVFERHYQRNNGANIIVEIHEKLIRDADGKVVGIRSAMIDVTERRAAEERASNASRWLVTTLRSMADGVIAADALGAITIMNPAAERLTGWTEMEAIGRDLGCVLHVQEDGRICTPVEVQRIVLNPDSATIGKRTVLCSRSGTEHRVGISFTPIMNEQLIVLGVAVVIQSSHQPE